MSVRCHCALALTAELLSINNTLAVDEVSGEREARVTAAREATVAIYTTLFTTAVPLRTFIYVCYTQQTVTQWQLYSAQSFVLQVYSPQKHLVMRDEMGVW